MCGRQNVMIHLLKGLVYVASKGIMLVYFHWFDEVYSTQVYIVENIRIGKNVKIQEQGP